MMLRPGFPRMPSPKRGRASSPGPDSASTRSGPDGDVALFDGGSDRLRRDGSGMVGQDDDLLDAFGPARLGARYSSAEDLSGAEGPAAAVHHRAGPLVVAPLSQVRPRGTLAGAAFLMGQVYLRPPCRSGLVVLAGVILLKDVRR
jgi:hypothetical protein